MLTRILAAIAAALVLAGCSAEPLPSPPTSPDASESVPLAVPADGVRLRDLGFLHAPSGFTVPEGLTIIERVDAANNVTAVVRTSDGGRIADYLRQHLPAMGFTITADRDLSLRFTDGTHDGAFTVTGDLAALSLRTDRG
ncbi:hypothetical protein [Tessaracoccus flavus]|uniref:Uncharacterized protein n=1 Tax=Tessaracoccus flavus TaxID=1610493 RepID=A0A1Q2CFX8_9ACTN|nr:hypothetical protein [Tessaracoccus flavus]AQP45021.1 hypothetical protein RPIT_09670 [Tessaracoccus flavus]SDY58977.1 hypothetical protein SAMN05428934_102371 [Tessaracoccus flavus]